MATGNIGAPTASRYLTGFAIRMQQIAIRIRSTLGRYASACLFVFAVAVVGLSIVYGLKKGMDGVFATPLDTRAQQMAAAISDSAYNLDLKYAMHSRVFDTLLKGGMSDVPDNYRPLGLRSPPYRDTAFWNALITKAATLEGIKGTPSVADRTLNFIFVEDHGLVDFYKLSFRLFGYNIQGFFNIYFLMLGATVCLFFAAFWTRQGILLSGNLLLVGLFVAICCMENPEYGISTVSNGRFLNTLVVLPVFHLAVLLLAPPRVTIVGFLAALAQAAFVGFVITMRGNAIWALLFFGISAFGLIAMKVYAHWANRPLRDFVRGAITWPMVAIVLGVVSVQVHHKANVHPAYAAMDELQAGHYFWHSLAYGLGMGEPESVLPELDGRRGDELGTYLGNIYLKRIIGFEHPNPSIYFASNLFPEWGRPKSYERVVRSAFLDFARTHPGYVLHVTFIVKPRMLVRLYFDALKRTVSRNAGYLALIAMLLVATLWVVPKSAVHSGDFRYGIWLIGGLAAAALLPSLAAYPAMISSGDAFALIVALLVAGAVASGWERLHAPAATGPAQA